MKFLIPLLVISLLVACDHQSLKQDQIQTIKVLTGQKCMIGTPTDETCDTGDYVAKIELNVNGEPIKVDTIKSCAGKKITWQYKDDFTDDAPQFLVIFEPEIYPGGSSGGSYNVFSKPKIVGGKVTNQKFKLNTRSKKFEEGECLNYAIFIPGKAILDPVFIIER
jgi:hypothetical protein